jgi:hypothetical protein
LLSLEEEEDEEYEDGFLRFVGGFDRTLMDFVCFFSSSWELNEASRDFMAASF